MTVMTPSPMGFFAPSRRSGTQFLLKLAGLLVAAVLVGLAMMLGA